MILNIEANDGAALPCGCPVHGTKVFHNGDELNDVTVVKCERGDPVLYGKRVLVWTIITHARAPDGTMKIIEDERGRRPWLKFLHVAEFDEREIELRCKHHPKRAAEPFPSRSAAKP